MNKSCVHNLRIHFLRCHVKLTHAGNLFVTFFSFFCVCVHVCCFKLLITNEHVLYLQLTGYICKWLLFKQSLLSLTLKSQT